MILDKVTSLSCSPDGKYLISGSEEDTVMKVWSLFSSNGQDYLLIPEELQKLEGHSSNYTFFIIIKLLYLIKNNKITEKL